MTGVGEAIDAVLGPAEAGHERVVRKGPSRRHLLLPALHSLQDRFGCVSQAALTELADRLRIPIAEAYGVATFYALIDVQDDGGGEAHHVCDDIVCRRKPPLEIPTPSSVHSSPCLGQCDRGPAAYVHAPGEHPNRSVLHSGGSQPVIGWIGEPRLLKRVGNTDATSLSAYLGSGGFEALSAALQMGPLGVIEAVERAGLRGRGGAAFPTAAKWRAVRDSAEAERYLVCNADESEPGTFKDRVLMEGDPFALVEALTIAAFTVGARRAYVYVRGEYPDAERCLIAAVAAATDAGHLDLPDGRLEIEVRRGGGAYICGEETALFNSIEGYRGEPRNKPPYPTEAGLFGKPTVVNNVETLVNALPILTGDPLPESRLFCVSGDVATPGTYEVPLGTSLGEVLQLAGGVTGEFRAVLLGGAAGSFVTPDQLDLELSFEAARAAGVSMGSGVVMALNSTADFDDLLVRVAQFFRDESCGQCVPCRVGTVRQHEALQRREADRELIDDLGAVMADASICGLGHTAATAVQSALAQGLISMEVRR